MCSCKLSVALLIAGGIAAVTAKPVFLNGVAIPGIGTVYGYLPSYPQEYPQGTWYYPQGDPGVYPQEYPGVYPQGNPGVYPQGNPGVYPQGNPGSYPGYPQYPTNDSPGETETFDPSTGPRNELPWAKGTPEQDDLNKLIQLNRLVYADDEITPY